MIPISHKHCGDTRGFILPIVALLMIALMGASLAFFGRATDSSKLSGYSKDSTQAVLLAESALNRVFGRYVSPDVGVNDIDGNKVGDANGQGRPAGPNLPLNLPYQFFLSADGATMDQSVPGILQRVADGEARGASATTAAPATQAIATAPALLRVNDLFISAATRPRLYTQGSTGLTASANTWAAETSPEKVAVWIEVVRDPDPANSDWFHLYLSAAAQVGQSRAYLQRYMGRYKDTLGGFVPTLSEARNRAPG